MSTDQSHNEEALIAEWDKAKEEVTKSVDHVQELKKNNATKEEIKQAVGEMAKARENVTRIVRNSN